MPAADFQTHPVFRRGAAPRVRLLIYVIVCMAMVMVDLRMGYFDAPRQYLHTITYPVRAIAAESTRLLGNATHHLSNLGDLQTENAELRQRKLDDASKLLRFEELKRENGQLRELLGMSREKPVVSFMAEVLYNVPDSFSRKVILDQGKQAGIVPGLAVADAGGLVGQVTRIYPIQSEVTLITDSNQPVPVRVQRNGLHGVTFGNRHGLRDMGVPEASRKVVQSNTGDGLLELRYVLAGADVQPGDVLETSGLDGVFLPGLPVAVVESVDHRDAGGFARIICRPLGGVERSTRVLVLGREALPAPMPKPETGEPPLPPKVRQAVAE